MRVRNRARENENENGEKKNKNKNFEAFLIFYSAISQVIKRMFRPWLQMEWFRKITNYQKKLIWFQNFSDEIMDGVK